VLSLTNKNDDDDDDEWWVPRRQHRHAVYRRFISTIPPLTHGHQSWYVASLQNANSIIIFGDDESSYPVHNFPPTLIPSKNLSGFVSVSPVVLVRAGAAREFCSLAVLDPRVGHTTDVLSPLISVLCHSDWLFHGESCPRLDVVHPGRAWPSSPACTWHCSVHYLFLQTATPLFPHIWIRHDTRCYFNVRSKADMSRLNLSHGNDNWKVYTGKLKSNGKSLENPFTQSWRRKGKAAVKDLQKKKEFKSGMKEWVGDGKLIIISMTVSSINDRIRFYNANVTFIKRPFHSACSAYLTGSAWVRAVYLHCVSKKTRH